MKMWIHSITKEARSDNPYEGRIILPTPFPSEWRFSRMYINIDMSILRPQDI